MYLQLLAVSDATIARLQADPPLAWRLITPDEPEREATARAELQPRPRLLARLFGRGEEQIQPAAPPPLELEPGEGDLGPLGDFEKSWHGLHYLLTGSDWRGEPPLNFLLADGTEIDIGLDQSPARVHTSGETRDIARALASQADDDLRARFDPARMMELEIYPETWDRPGELDHLLDAVRQLREVLELVVDRRHGLLVSIT